MMYVHRLVTDEGFIRAFWNELAERRKVDPSVSQEDVYEALNEEYRSVFGTDRFRSFDAFRKRRDR